MTSTASTVTWTPWTSKSETIPFKSSTTGVGDGEEKVAAEFNTTSKGQNSTYDMTITLDGVQHEAEVKKLDKNTFNIGVNGRDLLRPIKNKLGVFLQCIRSLQHSSLSPPILAAIAALVDISPDEVCASNIRRISNLCSQLHDLQTELTSTLPTISPFNTPDGKAVTMSIADYAKICKILNTPFPAEYTSFTETIHVLDHLTHEYIADPTLFVTELKDLRTMFSEFKLIFVDESKGFCVWNDNSKLEFERITRGHPRFRVIMD